MNMEGTHEGCYARSYFLVLNEMPQFLLIPTIEKVEDICYYSSELDLRLSNLRSESTFCEVSPSK